MEVQGPYNPILTALTRPLSPLSRLKVDLYLWLQVPMNLQVGGMAALLEF